jgi:hypothetical protein
MAFCGVLCDVLAHAMKNCKNAPVSLCVHFGPAELIFMKFLIEWFNENQTFYILVTVHLGIILINNQLDVHFLLYV